MPDPLYFEDFPLGAVIEYGGVDVSADEIVADSVNQRRRESLILLASFPYPGNQSKRISFTGTSSISPDHV
jgi:hypothetical protein